MRQMVFAMFLFRDGLLTLIYIDSFKSKSLCSEIKMYSVTEKSIALLNIQTE